MMIPLHPRLCAARPSNDGEPALCAGLGAIGDGMRPRGLTRFVRFSA